MDRIAVGSRFESYWEFRKTLKAYEEESNTLFVKRRTTKMSPLTPANLVEKFMYDEVVLECKHGSIRASKSKGIRPNQRSLKLGCKAFIKLQLKVFQESSSLVIVKLDLSHTGHVPSRESVSILPEKRKFVVTPGVIELLGSEKVNTRCLKDFICNEQNVVMFSRDIHNWRSKRKKIDDSSDQEKINTIVDNIVQDGGKVEFSKDDEDNLIHFCWQTVTMIKTLQNYPEVLVMDITYKTNKYLFPLVTVLAIDSSGKCLPVFHSLLSSENNLALSRCLESLKASFGKIKTSCFFVDKDFSEVGALTAVFPGVGVFLGAFHIRPALEEAFSKVHMDKSLSEALMNFFMMMKNSQALSDYEFIKMQITKVAPKDVMDYLQANWWNKPEVWANYTKLDTMCLDAKTVKHCESYHSKLKKVLNHETTLSRVISYLMEQEQQMYQQSHKASAITANCRYYKAGSSSSVIDAIKDDITPFAAEHVIKNLMAAEKYNYTVTKVNEGDDSWVTSDKDSLYTTSFQSCSCVFHQNFGLPCRHIFFLRKSMGVSLYERLPEGCHFKLKDATDASFQQVSLLSSSTITENPPSDAAETKLLAASSIANNIATYLSSLGDEDFSLKFNALKALFSSWQGCAYSERGSELQKASESKTLQKEVEPVKPATSNVGSPVFTLIKSKKTRTRGQTQNK